MYYQQIILILLVLNGMVFNRDHTWVQFIKGYVENEKRPTFLLFDSTCWSKNLKVNLANQLSSIGCRMSTSMDDNFKYYYHDVLYMLDLDCADGEEALIEASSRNLFRSPFRWLVITTLTEESYTNILLNNTILVDSDVVVASRLENVITMTEVHKPSPNGTLVSTLRGYYNGSLLDVRPHREPFKRRKDVMGHNLTMSNVIQDSNNSIYHLPREDCLEPEYDFVSKMCWMNAKLAFLMLNATPRYIFNQRWGYKVNGTWSGMINDLQTGRADVGTNCAVSDIQRLEVVTYTDRLGNFRLGFIFRQPPLPYVANIFSMPFSTSVWFALLVCLFISSVTLYLSARWETTHSEVATGLNGLSDAVLLTLSALSQQGGTIDPKRTSGRIMMFVVFMALMALYAAYSANIIVLLQAPSTSIKTLAQLTSTKIALSALDLDYNHFIFDLFTDPVRVVIKNRVDPDVGKKQYFPMEEGVQRIKQGLFAMHAIVDPVYRRIEETFLESEKCDLEEIDFMNSLNPFAPIKKDSPYLELLRVVFKQIRESGVQSAITRRMITPKPRCDANIATFSSVGIMDLRPVMVLMLYGIGLSIVIVIGEILVHHLLHRRMRKLMTRRVGIVDRTSLIISSNNSVCTIETE